MAESDPQQTLHTTVLCYLATILAMADCVGEACPAVGGPYRTKLSRLRSRRALDSSAPALEESARIVANELRDYAKRAATFLESHSAGQRRAIEGLERLVTNLAQRQEFYGARIRQIVGDVD